MLVDFFLCQIDGVKNVMRTICENWLVGFCPLFYIFADSKIDKAVEA